jgi:hypothetical protein
MIAHNLPIYEDKITKGEIDFLVDDLTSNLVMHIELVYKFYLLDSPDDSMKNDQWIGPNRKDSLVLKVDKTNRHQLPLLKSSLCKKPLEILGLNQENVEQRVWFKAQLFTPYLHEFKWKSDLNKKCNEGFWCRMEDFKKFASDEDSFCIPEKKNWMVNPELNENWYSKDSTLNEIKKYLDVQRSPMCWMKNKEGQTKKFFIVWW